MTATTEPITELDERYSDPGAVPAAWADVQRRLATAPIAWIVTLRRDGRPHVTPLLSVWLAGNAHVVTGPGEQKWRNLAHDPRCNIMTGCDTYGEGTDVVVEGMATRVVDTDVLGRLAAAFEAKYGAEWRFEVGDGVFVHDEHVAHVFAIAPVTAYAFTKGVFSHTRFRFTPT